MKLIMTDNDGVVLTIWQINESSNRVVIETLIEYYLPVEEEDQ